jgi:putative membrane protein
MTDSAGQVQKIVVSDQLKNPLGEKKITDKSSLSDITNLKSNGSCTNNSDGTISWDAEANDVYYQGNSTKALPLNVTVSYTLDGKTISTADLAGKSGKVVIRYEYKEDKSAMGNTYVPFVAMTGMILKNDGFKNVTVSNGKIIDDGDKKVVVGFALPGMQDELKLGSTIDIPDYVEITADAADFAIDSTLTYATCDFAQDIDTSKINSVSDLSSALSQVTSAVTQLTDGSSQLYDGLCTLLEKSNEMTTGIGTLYTGATKLSSGLTTLDSNSAALKSGAYQVFKTLTSTAQDQLNTSLKANGLESVTLTPETYSSVLTGLLDTFSKGAYSKAQTAAEAQVRTAVNATVLAKVTDGVKDAVKAAVIAKGYSETQAEAYLTSSAGQETVASYVTAKMASDDIKATIESNVKEQLASSDVQAKITAAVDSGLSSNAGYASIKSLKTSLDSFSAFYAGLSTYTAGVSSAASGATQLTSGLGQLKTGSASLVSGVTKLRDGAMQLSDGVKEFSSKLSSKLGSLSTSDLTNAIPRISSMLNAAKSYKNYSGIADGVDGSVKFIYKTASIGD